MVNEAAHEDSICYHCGNYQDRCFMPSFFKEDEDCINAWGKKGHDKKVHHKLEIGVNTT